MKPATFQLPEKTLSILDKYVEKAKKKNPKVSKQSVVNDAILSALTKSEKKEGANGK